jgi:hypothetical protein
MDRSSEPTETEDSQQSLLSAPGRGDNPRSCGECQRGRRCIVRQNRQNPKIRNSRYSANPVAGTIPAASGKVSVSSDGSFIRTDRTRRFATVVTQRPRSRGQSPQLRGVPAWAAMDRSSEPTEPEDSQQSLPSKPGRGDNPRSCGEGQRGRRWIVRQSR